jgi:hypothetical protein
VRVAGQHRPGVRQHGRVLGILEVPVDRFAGVTDGQGQRGLAHLPRTEQSHGRLDGQQVFDPLSGGTGNHHCKNDIMMLFLQ